MRVGVMLSRVRVEEKLLFAELDARGVDWERIDDPELVMHLDRPIEGYDVILERAINHTRALYALRVFNDWGIPTVNTYEVAEDLRQQAADLDRAGARTGCRRRARRSPSRRSRR